MTDQGPSETTPASPTTSAGDERDRVRRHTSAESLWHIDEKTRRNVRYYAVQPASRLDARIDDLKRQWEMERVLETNASLLALGGAVLGLTTSRKWFLLTSGVMTFLFQHAVLGWCPPVPMFRKLGVRTQNELDQERLALKALRGDFRPGVSQPPTVEQALRAVET